MGESNPSLSICYFGRFLFDLYLKVKKQKCKKLLIPSYLRQNNHLKIAKTNYGAKIYINSLDYESLGCRFFFIPKHQIQIENADLKIR